MSGGHAQLRTRRDESSGETATSAAPLTDMAIAGTRAHRCEIRISLAVVCHFYSQQHEVLTFDDGW